MLPRLYEGKLDLESYNKNGLGFFNSVKSCEVTEERNGEYFLKLSIYKNDRLRDTVVPGMVVKAKSNSSDPPQLFEICDNIEVDKYGNLSLTAMHIKSVYMKNVTAQAWDVKSVTGTPAEINAKISEVLAFQSGFTFYSDITDSKAFKKGWSTGESLEDIFYKEDGMIDIYGGSLYFDNFSVSLLKQRGRNTAKALRYGMNISDYTQTITSAEVYSHILPYADVEDLNDGDDIRIAIPPIETGASVNEFKKVKLIDFSKKCKKYKVNSSNGAGYTELEAHLLELGNARVEKYKEKLTTPSVNIKVTYKAQLDDLQDLRLCDRVKLYYGNYITRVRLIKTVYDSIHERYTSLEFGDKKLKLTDLI